MDKHECNAPDENRIKLGSIHIWLHCLDDNPVANILLDSLKSYPPLKILYVI